MSKAPLTTLTLCSLQQWARAQMNRAFAIMEQYVNTGFHPRAFPLAASAAGPRALRSWGVDAIIFCLAEASVSRKHRFRERCPLFCVTAASVVSGTLFLKRENKRS